MEKFIKKYIKDVRKCITLNSKEEKYFIQTFSKELNNAYDNKEFNDIHELNEVFGFPNEVAASYIKTISNLQISKYMKSKKAHIVFIIILILSIICIYTFRNYRLNQLIDEVHAQYQNSSDK